MPNFSFPTSFNQTTASSSTQAFLLVPDVPPKVTLGKLNSNKVHSEIGRHHDAPTRQ